MVTPKIIINSTWCKQRVVSLNKPVTRIGRTPDNDIIFTHQCVSRSHAIITRVNDEFVIEDKSSKHGTYINREKITQRQLKNRDLIHLGLVKETEMLFQAEESLITTPGFDWTEFPQRTERSDFHPRDLEMLLEISKALNSTLVLQDVLNLVMDAVIQLTKANHGFLMLIDAEGELEFKVARNMKKESLGQEEFRISRSIVTRVAQTGEPILSGNVLQDDSFKSQQSVMELQLKTVMCVPLKIVNPNLSRVIGVIYVDNRVITPTFSQKTVDLLEYLSSHAAIAIENAKLHEETKIKERMQKELEIAYEIQTSLLPQSYPDVPGLEIFARSIPAAQVGGDFYNFIPLSPRRIGIAIGDVIGKSVPAALYMSATHSTLETLLAVKENLTPQEVIVTLNSLFCKKSRGSKFVTFCYGIIDLELGLFTFSNAGHNYPILLRQGRCREIECTGPALGMFDGEQFESNQVSLEANDVIILYTDGIVESLNSVRTMFGFEQLTTTIQTADASTADSLGISILDKVSRHSEGGPQFDDMTLLCFKINSLSK